MSEPLLLPSLLVLAGTSEAGKSTAGAYLASRGVRRVKIRTILQALASGVEVTHEGVASRSGFDSAEFLTGLWQVAEATTEPVIVVESFIDAQLADLTRSSWPSPCAVAFITARRRLRVGRHAAANDLTYSDSSRVVAGKDARKQVDEQLPVWRQVADHWIDNDGTLAALEATLSAIVTTLARNPGDCRP